MRFIINRSKKIILFISAIFVCCIGYAQSVNFEKSESFYPNSEAYRQDSITWGFLNVPENWEDTASSTIKVAVSILHNLSHAADAPAVVFIQGGPGASGTQNIRSWRNHPLRKKNDIILLDLRGTGFSEPRLCENLGAEFVEILAKNQSKEEDEQQKALAALSCKQELINRGIDISAYHSLSIARDLHALKTQLSYNKWIIYGVSYGTFVAQVYASQYPNDIRKLVLDSSILDITTYYTQNTSNYMSSLAKVFQGCKNDNECNSRYPNLEEVFYETIKELDKNPITVNVGKELVPTGTFTYNAEDFKVAVQQALYNKQLVEVIPLLIYQFKERNETALVNLVEAFTTLLGMDYGVYYSVSCNEALPNNNRADYQENAAQFKELKGGLSFYASDFTVCDKWELNSIDSLIDYKALKNANFPVLVFSGEYDPITPAFNGEKVAGLFSNSKAITGLTYGHVPSFTKTGNKVAQEFIDEGKFDASAFKQVRPISFVKDIILNAGVSRFGNSLNDFDLVFFIPLLIALVIMLAFIFSHLIKLLRNRYKTLPDKIVRIFSIITSITGVISLFGLVLAMIEVSNQNHFILAFGLPANFDYIITLLFVFIVLVVLTLLYFIFQVKKINDRSIVFSLIFSQVLLGVYIYYWGLV